MLWAFTVATVGVVAASLVLTLASSELDLRDLRAFLFFWIVVPYAVSGILAWWKRPASRLGPLMLATALAMALSSLQWSAQAQLHSIGNLLDMLPAALFLHVFLAFPTGRLTSRADRSVVMSGYLDALVLQLAKIVLGSNPANVFVLESRPAIGNLVRGSSSG